MMNNLNATLPPTTWIMIADASRARIFKRVRETWSLVENIDNPDGRAKAADLVTDGEGRAQNSGGHGGAGHSTKLAQPTSLKERESERFAKQLVSKLGAANAAHTFDQLVVVAPPHFLGTLRAELPEPIRRIMRDFPHDLTNVPESELPAHLQKMWTD